MAFLHGSLAGAVGIFAPHCINHRADGVAVLITPVRAGDGLRPKGTKRQVFSNLQRWTKNAEKQLITE